MRLQSRRPSGERQVTRSFSDSSSSRWHSSAASTRPRLRYRWDVRSNHSPSSICAEHRAQMPLPSDRTLSGWQLSPAATRQHSPGLCGRRTPSAPSATRRRTPPVLFFWLRGTATRFPSQRGTIVHDQAAIATEFWRLAGAGASHPRDLEAAVLWTLPLAVVKLPRLGTDAVSEWLAQGGFEMLVPTGHRSLRACIVAARGRGFVFIDGADSESEQRYSLAHETAHFLLDYFLPRRAALQAFGESILQVLDGDRQPNDEERFSAVLRGVRLGVYSRLWQRGAGGLSEDLETVAREDAADALALELLAPRSDALRAAKAAGWNPGAVAQLLQSRFALPHLCAVAYARQTCVVGKPAPSFREWLGARNA